LKLKNPTGETEDHCQRGSRSCGVA